MADRVLLITWKMPVRGREERAIEVFNESLGLYGRLQQEGHIERFDATILAPNVELNGYIQLHGTAAQLAEVREREDFQRLTADAQMICEDLCMIDGFTGAGIARQMAIYQEAVAKVPQFT